MATTPNRGYALPSVGDTGWGVTLNSNDFTIIDLNFGGRQIKTVAGIDVTLSSDDCQNVYIILSGTLSADINVIWPVNNGGFFFVYNASTGAHTITAKPSGGTGIVIPQTAWSPIFINPDDGTANIIATPQVLSAQGDLLYRGADTVARLPAGTDGQFLQTQGSGADPVWASTPIPTLVPIANGGTGETTATDAFNALSPQTTRGDIIIRDASNDVRLAVGTAGYVLASNGTDPGYAIADLPMPQGRLSLTSATPVQAADVSGATTVYWCLYGGSRYPWYNGTYWTVRSIAQLSLALDSNSGHTGYQQSGKNFDLFLYNDSGTDRLVSGPAWTSDTARASAISQVNGIYVNTGSMTGKYDTSSSTLTMAASQATYVGTMRASANGQTTWTASPAAASGGGNSQLLLWNCYNRVNVAARSQDNTASWSYSTATWRAADNNTSNRISVVRGLNEDGISAVYTVGTASGDSSPHTRYNGIGLDSTTAPAASCGVGVLRSNTGNSNSVNSTLFENNPGIGFHYIQALESGAGDFEVIWNGVVGGNQVMGLSALVRA